MTTKRASIGAFSVALATPHWVYFTTTPPNLNALLPTYGENSSLPSICKAKMYDVMLEHHLRFPSLPHDLEFIGSCFSSKPAWKSNKVSMQLYNARDVDVTLQAHLQLYPLLKQAGLLDLYNDVQVPLAKICKMMSDRGVKLDSAHIDAVREKYQKQIVEEQQYLPKEIRTYAVKKQKRVPAPPGTLSEKTGKPVKYTHIEIEELKHPWRATEWKHKYLYGKEESWQLGEEPVVDPDKKKVTTGKMAQDQIANRYRREVARLQLLKTDHSAEIAELQRKARELQALRNVNKWDKLIGTFLQEDRTSKISRVHTSFNVHGTGTGRLSSSDPNLQNQPDPVRFMYVPTEPCDVILSVDYSGIENRLQAFFAHDTARLERLSEPGFSEHKFLASLISGVPMEEIEKSIDPDSDYSKAKHVVHGVDRGLGPTKAAQKYDMDLLETKKLFALWKDQIRPTIQWQERCADQAKRQGYLVNPFGRKAWFYTENAYTESLSFPPQSTAADVIFRAMIGMMYERIGWPEERVAKLMSVYEPLPAGVNLLLQVHDELVFELHHSLLPETARIITRVMTQPWPQLLGMSLPISISVGRSWGEVEKYKA